MKLFRGCAVALSVLSGVVHLALAPGHHAGSPLFGVAFAADGAAFLAIAVALVVSAKRWVWGATAGIAGATVLAYVTVGEVLSTHSHASGSEMLGLGVTAGEVVLLALALWALVGASAPRIASQRARALSVSTVMSIPFVLALAVSASAAAPDPVHVDERPSRGSIRSDVGNEQPAKHAHVVIDYEGSPIDGGGAHEGEHRHGDANATDAEP